MGTTPSQNQNTAVIAQFLNSRKELEARRNEILESIQVMFDLVQGHLPSDLRITEVFSEFKVENPPRLPGEGPAPFLTFHGFSVSVLPLPELILCMTKLPRVHQYIQEKIMGWVRSRQKEMDVLFGGKDYPTPLPEKERIREIIDHMPIHNCRTDGSCEICGLWDRLRTAYGKAEVWRE